jgi:hypothetical protein
MSGAVGGLHPKSAMGPAMIVGEVIVENALSMLLVFEDDVVEAVPAQGAYDPVVRQNRIEGHERLQRGRDIQATRGRPALRPVLR